MEKTFLKISKAALITANLAIAAPLTALAQQQSIGAYSGHLAMQRIHKTKIQVALLLDTSNSMDGLIDQAKSSLWNIINTLSTLKYNGVTPDLEISLYEYGNNSLSAGSGFIRQVTPFTSNLDYLSQQLFSLRTNGGSEFCGYVINTAMNQLGWDDNSSSMKLVYIAGNESFNQGSVRYQDAISKARSSQIHVNTIFCGDYNTGLSSYWKHGADLGSGKYFNIDHNKKVRYVTTPYDRDLEVLNQQLNQTYYGYGKRGKAQKANQVVQDSNAGSMDKSIKIERTISKSKVQYSNADWDLVDAYKDNNNIAKELKAEELPSEFQDLSKQELEGKIKTLEKERTSIQVEIEKVSKKRSAYIKEQNKNQASDDDLGNAINASIIDLAKKMNYTNSH